MTLLDLPRIPEREVMGDAEEVEAYASAAAQAFLEAIDNTLVEHVLSFGPLKGWLLDLGTGPGGIPLKIVRGSPALRVVGVDCSRGMILRARQSAAEQDLSHRAFFFISNACKLPFPDNFFDVVLANSLLHHLREPSRMFAEMARIVKSGGLILLRDLRRPSRLAFPLHVRWYGRYYTGMMKKLYVDSVRAAYTVQELAGLIGHSALSNARLFLHGRTHLGFYSLGGRDVRS